MQGCKRCGAELPPLKYQGNPRKWCSQTCRAAFHREENDLRRYWPRCKVSFLTCTICGVFFAANRKRSWCSKPCQRKVKVVEHQRRTRALSGDARVAYSLKKRNDKAVRKARLRSARSERFDPREVFERDSWVCGICLSEVDAELIYPDPMSASLDHITPISRGGDHTRDNTRCSHLACNVRRGAATTELAMADARTH